VRMRTISNQSKHDEREPRTDISQVELQLHGLRAAPRRGLHQLRREDRGADPRGRSRRARRRAVLGRLPRGDRAVLLHPASALARAGHAMKRGRRSIERAKLRDLGPERATASRRSLRLRLSPQAVQLLHGVKRLQRAAPLRFNPTRQVTLRCLAPLASVPHILSRTDRPGGNSPGTRCGRRCRSRGLGETAAEYGPYC
jgi:hypothetical protein